MELMDTGWAELRALFHAMIIFLLNGRKSFEQSQNAFDFIERLLWIAEPRPVPEKGARNPRSTNDWPDPFEILCWRMDEPGSSARRSLFVLRAAGEKLIKLAKPHTRLPEVASKIARLQQLCIHLDASTGATGEGRDAVMSRRLVVTKALLEGYEQVPDRGETVRTRSPVRSEDAV
jgi:hypothetical protein